MAEIVGLVRALREGDDAAKATAARALGDFARYTDANRVLIAEAGGIPPLVDLLRDGSAAAKMTAAEALRSLACNDANMVTIAAAGGIPPLVDLLRDGSADAKAAAAATLSNLASDNDAIRVLIAAAGAIPPLVDVVRNGSAEKWAAAAAQPRATRPTSANAVAIAAVGLEALVELARGGRVTVNERWLVRNAGIAAKRKAALVVAALLRACVPEEHGPYEGPAVAAEALRRHADAEPPRARRRVRGVGALAEGAEPVLEELSGEGVEVEVAAEPVAHVREELGP
ncbi:hypothetical protein JL722_1246 [Aureococcus anophagefferens]|nr:hypothetical protein JL722_1246 [Aureococcus anophagefferens]